MRRFMFFLLPACTHFFEICSSFTKLRHNSKETNGSKFEWNEDHSAALGLLIERLCNAPAAAFYEDSLDTAIHINARVIVCEAVFAQKPSPGWRPASFSSRIYFQQTTFSTTKRECFGILYFTKELQQYILARPVMWVNGICWLRKYAVDFLSADTEPETSAMVI